MGAYTKEDVQNTLADLQNEVALTTATTHYGVPRNTLRGRLNDVQSCRSSHNDEQRLSTAQEQRLELWILRQEALGYAPTHAQVRAIASGILK